jgi:hypothetical protein
MYGIWSVQVVGEFGQGQVLSLEISLKETSGKLTVYSLMLAVNKQ